MHGIDYYELLGVRRDASAAEIRSAYRGLAKALHPDAGGTSGAFRLLRDAYETLTDPDRRTDYDHGDHGGSDRGHQPSPPPRRARRFGADPDHVPTLPAIDVTGIPWWDQVRPDRGGAPRHGPVVAVAAVAAIAGGALLLDLLGAPVGLTVLAALAAGVAAVVVGRRRLAAWQVDRAFTAEFGSRTVFGRPGVEPDEAGERLTADLLARYLTRLPGVRIFHGLAAEVGSVFADIDHAVLCGRRLVLIESKLWLPGHYDVDEAGGVWRNGHRFRGGAVQLPDRLAAYRALLPGVEVRGALLLYPSREGEITIGDHAGAVFATVPAGFVREVGGWLAAGPSTVDQTAFHILVRQVVSAS